MRPHLHITKSKSVNKIYAITENCTHINSNNNKQKLLFLDYKEREGILILSTYRGFFVLYLEIFIANKNLSTGHTSTS